MLRVFATACLLAEIGVIEGIGSLFQYGNKYGNDGTCYPYAEGFGSGIEEGFRDDDTERGRAAAYLHCVVPYLFQDGVANPFSENYINGPMCPGNSKHYSRFLDSLAVGSFGGADAFLPGSNFGEKDCGAWCVYDMRNPKHSFRWKGSSNCWDFQKYKCKDSTEQEREYAQQVHDNLCEDDDGAIFSCMAGKTRVEAIRKESQSTLFKLGLTSADAQMVEVQHLEEGDYIRGLDADKKPKWCKVKSVGTFGQGYLWGNYTTGHYILNHTTGNVQKNGLGNVKITANVTQIKASNARVTFDDKYDVLTDCPVGVDEAGKGFTALDTDFCGKEMGELAWSDYLTLHNAILRIVAKSGSFWFSMHTYNAKNVKKYTSRICAGMLKCAGPEKECDDMEKVAIEFFNNSMVPETAQKAKDAFPDLGDVTKEGSVAYTVSGRAAFHETTEGIVIISSASVILVGVVATVVAVMRRRRNQAIAAQQQKTINVEPINFEVAEL